MNSPFTLVLAIQTVGQDVTEYLGNTHEGTYRLRVTLDHVVRDIKEQIWAASREYRLNPLFIKILYQGQVRHDSERICDIINSPEVSGDVSGFTLVVDLTMFFLPSIPRREPVPEYFNTRFRGQVNGRDVDVTRRYTLNSTIGSIKEELGEKWPAADFHISYEGVIAEDDTTLAQVIGLDVVPHQQVDFEVGQPEPEPLVEPTLPERNGNRFHIKLETSEPALQENNLFEVTRATTVAEFKQLLIDRMDTYSVRRTFLDQVLLSHNDTAITRPDEALVALFEALGLSSSVLEQHNYIITLKLEIGPHLAGGGIFSRQFWNDLRSPTRFEFLPNSSHVLAIDGGDGTGARRTWRPTPIEAPRRGDFVATGHTVEVFRDPYGNDRYIDDAYASTQLYQFRVGDREVDLTTSQCILVEGESPYIMVSPSGIHKLASLADAPPGPEINVSRSFIGRTTSNGVPPPTRTPPLHNQHAQHAQHARDNGGAVPPAGAARDTLLHRFTRRVGAIDQARQVAVVGFLVRLALFTYMTQMHAFIFYIPRQVLGALAGVVTVGLLTAYGQSFETFVQEITHNLRPSASVRVVRLMGAGVGFVSSRFVSGKNAFDGFIVRRAVDSRPCPWEKVVATSTHDYRWLVQYHVSTFVSDVFFLGASLLPGLYTKTLDRYNVWVLVDSPSLERFIKSRHEHIALLLHSLDSTGDVASLTSMSWPDFMNDGSDAVRYTNCLNYAIRLHRLQQRLS